MNEERQQQAHDANIYSKLAIEAIDWADNNPSFDTVKKIITAYNELLREYPEFFSAVSNDNHVIYVLERLKINKSKDD